MNTKETILPADTVTAIAINGPAGGLIHVDLDSIAVRRDHALRQRLQEFLLESADSCQWVTIC